MQKIPCLLLSILVFVRAGAAQEALPLEEAREAARKLGAFYTLPADAPLKLELNADQPRAIKGHDSGVMLIPDKRLTSETLATVGKTILPIGELWALKVAMEDHGAAVGKDKLRVISVGEGDERRQLSLFLFGVKKNEQDLPELLVFGKDNEPLLRVPLQKSTAGKQSTVEITARKRDESSAILTINLLGEYTADLPMVKAAE